MDDNKTAVLIVLILCLSTAIAAIGITYNESMEVKYATENGYHQEVVNGRKVWIKDGRE